MKRTIIIILTFLMVVAFNEEKSEAAGLIVTNGLVGYWHYKDGVSGTVWNNIAPDTVGQYNGTINGAVLDAYGVYFDGTNDSVNGIAMAQNSYTIEAWVRTVSLSSQPIVNFDSHSVNSAVLTANNTGDYWSFYNNGGNLIGSIKNNNLLTHVVLTMNGSSRRSYLYVNGLQAGTTTHFPVMPIEKIWIGHRGTTQYLKGHIKSVKVYNRPLSLAEIQQNYSVSSDEIGLTPLREWNLTSPSTFVDLGEITVNHQTQTVSGNLGTMSVFHQGANSDGWRVTVSATPFAQINGGSLTLPVNTFRLRGIQSVNQVSGTSILPVVQGAYPINIDQGAVEILRGNPNEAEGDFNVSFVPNALELLIDTARAVVDPLNNPTRYSSTITWSMSVGP